MAKEYNGEDEEWSEFEVWYDTQITRFQHGQFSDKQKAYAAWLKAKEPPHNVAVAPDECSCQNEYTYDPFCPVHGENL